MPRTTRSRVASNRDAQIAKDPSPAPEQVPESSLVYETSDGEKERRRSRRTSARTSFKATSTTNPRQTALIDAARTKRDAALERLENITSNSVAENTNTAEEEDTESSIEVELGRRAVAATPAHAPRMNDLSGLDLDDSMFDDLNTTIDTAGTASAQRSLDTSTLSASNFKRRPRAGSFLSRDDGPLRPSSRAGPNTPGISSTFNIGVFKRRAREPSILGTTQKPRAERPEPESDSGDKSDDEAELAPAGDNDFSPEAGSTPLRRSTRQSGVVASEQEALESSLVGKTRKRKSTEAHQQRRRTSPSVENNPDNVEESENDSLSSPPSSPPIRRRQSTPLLDENVAPPESSGSEDEAEAWPPLKSLAKSRSRRPPPAVRKTPEREVAHHDNSSDMSSPPSLTYSPNFGELSPPPKPAPKQTRAAAKPVSTADLTGLLPRRRQRKTRSDPLGIDNSDDEEVDTAALGNEDDELSYLDVRTRRRPAKPLSRPTTDNPGVQNKSAQRKGKGPASAKPTRTYGRLSDKENEEDEEDEEHEPSAGREDGASENSEEMVTRIGQELKNASRKFAEVDKWELNFEERTQSSSPRDAR